MVKHKRNVNDIPIKDPPFYILFAKQKDIQGPGLTEESINYSFYGKT
jgi:hypothetical protein